MTSYDFERFSVLVVDDTSYMRLLVSSVLKALGFGKILGAEDGGPAIDLLKLIAEKPEQAGVMSLDLVVTNWQMSPVDGPMLIKWIRRSKESPDRFLPVIMLTAHADADMVQRGWDVGATEFLVKPFSIQSLCDRLVSIIERPRQFVLASEYFGPDRRRQLTDDQEVEQRVLTEDDIEIIYHAG